MHRAVLAGGLLDSRLADALRSAAMSGPETKDDAPAADDRVRLDRVTGKIKVDDPAEGGGSYIRVEVGFAAKGGEPVFFKDEVAAPYERDSPFEIAVDRSLDELVSWRFTFINPGFMADQRTSFTPVDLALHAKDSSWQVDSPGQITLEPGDKHSHVSAFTPPAIEHPPKRAEAEPAGQLQQLLRHLNANRPYYRMLIDLLTDPVTRFVRLSERHPELPMPADLRPIGVAGAHLAFLTGEEGTSPGDERPPIKRVLATPAGGTFVEVLEGRTEVEMAASPPAWPTVALAPEHTMPWPAPIELPTVENVEKEGDDEEEDAAAGAPPSEAELPGELAKIMKTLETLQSAVAALTPKAPEPPAKEDPAEDPAAKEEAPAQEGEQP